jgi:hypothetical protein
MKPYEVSYMGSHTQFDFWFENSKVLKYERSLTVFFCTMSFVSGYLNYFVSELCCFLHQVKKIKKAA